MTKKQQVILIGGTFIVLGVFLALALNTNPEEDSGNTQTQDEDGNTPPADGTDTITVEEQTEVGNPNEIVIGDYITPYGEYTRVRESTSLDNGWDDNFYEDGDLDAWGYSDDGKVYSGNIIGKVTNIITIADAVWYSVNVCAVVNGVYDTIPNVEQEMAQDSCDADVGYVIQSVCNGMDCIPNVKKVI